MVYRCLASHLDELNWTNRIGEMSVVILSLVPGGHVHIHAAWRVEAWNEEIGKTLAIAFDRHARVLSFSSVCLYYAT